MIGEWIIYAVIILIVVWTLYQIIIDGEILIFFEWFEFLFFLMLATLISFIFYGGEIIRFLSELLSVEAVYISFILIGLLLFTALILPIALYVRDRKTQKEPTKIIVEDEPEPDSKEDPIDEASVDPEKTKEELSEQLRDLLEWGEKVKNQTAFEQQQTTFPRGDKQYYFYNKPELVELMQERIKEIKELAYNYLKPYNQQDNIHSIIFYYQQRVEKDILKELLEDLEQEDGSKLPMEYFNKRYELTTLLKDEIFKIFDQILGETPKPSSDKTISPRLYSMTRLMKNHPRIDTPQEWSTFVIGLFEDLSKKSDGAFLKKQMNYLEKQMGRIHDRHWNDKKMETNEKAYNRSITELYGKSEKEAFSSVYNYTLFRFSDFGEVYKPTTLPFTKRYEHTHVLGGSGHGKTQLLQNIITADIQNMVKNRTSVIVIDGQGELIENILKMKAVHDIKDRVVVVDPSDVENPFCLNPFNLRGQFNEGMSSLDKANLFNSTIQLLTFVFSSLLETKLTAKQETLFNNVLALLVHRQGSDLDTMFDVLNDHTQFTADIDQLPKHPKNFFLTEFDSKNYSETRDQVKTRLNAILSKPALASMFSTRENKLNMFAEMNRGALILVDTNKDLLKKDGHSLLGRYFIEHILQAALRRKDLDRHEKTPCFVFVDEAQDYLDENTAELLAQARKQRVGMILAHQYLNQLTPNLKSAFGANTQIKFVGNVNPEDRSYAARNTGAKEDTIRSLKKIDYVGAEHILKIGTSKYKKIHCPFGVLEGLPKVSKKEVESLLADNRLKYCEPISGAAKRDFNNPPAPPKDEPTTESDKSSGGFSATDFEDF